MQHHHHLWNRRSRCVWRRRKSRRCFINRVSSKQSSFAIVIIVIVRDISLYVPYATSSIASSSTSHAIISNEVSHSVPDANNINNVRRSSGGAPNEAWHSDYQLSFRNLAMQDSSSNFSISLPTKMKGESRRITHDIWIARHCPLPCLLLWQEPHSNVATTLR